VDIPVKIPINITHHYMGNGFTRQDLLDILLTDWEDKYFPWVSLQYQSEWIDGLLISDTDRFKRILTFVDNALVTYEFDPCNTEMVYATPRDIRSNTADGVKFNVLTSSNQHKPCWFEGDRIKIQDGDIVVDITNATRAYKVACKLEVN